MRLVLYKQMLQSVPQRYKHGRVARLGLEANRAAREVELEHTQRRLPRLLNGNACDHYKVAISIRSTQVGGFYIEPLG